MFPSGVKKEKLERRARGQRTGVHDEVLSQVSKSSKTCQYEPVRIQYVESGIVNPILLHGSRSFRRLTGVARRHLVTRACLYLRVHQSQQYDTKCIATLYDLFTQDSLVNHFVTKQRHVDEFFVMKFRFINRNDIILAWGRNW